MKMKYYSEYITHQKDDSPLYIFDSSFGEVSSVTDHLQCWKLAPDRSPMRVFEALDEYKSSINRPFGEYSFIFGKSLILSLNIGSTYFIFHFGKNTSKENLPVLFILPFLIFRDAQIIC